MQGNLINYIVKFGTGDKYIKLSNIVGQCWYFPYSHTRNYMSLFQPSSLKGAIVALILPYIKFCSWILPFVRAEIVRLKVDDDFISILEKSFNCQDIACSFFCGSPGKHQKPTLLVASKHRCVGYCKISDRAEVIDIFKKEKKTLDSLQVMGVRNIPNVNYCAQWDKNPSMWIFVQSTQRNDRVKVARIEDREVWDFVSEMYEKTKIETLLEETDFGKALNNLESLLPLLADGELIDVVRKNIVEVQKELAGERCAYTASHGDLTPWNSFIVDNHLYAFDFEYFKATYPPFVDYFHFFTQSLIYDYYATADKIWSKYQELKHSVFNKIDNCDFLYKCYLLTIIEFYLNRDNGILNSRLEESFKIWIELLIKIKNNGGGTQ